MRDGAEAELSDEALQLLDHAEHQIELAFRLATYSDHADGMARVIDRFARVEGALADHAAKLRTALVARPAASAKGSVRSSPKPALRGTQSFGSLAVKGEKPDDAFDNGHHDLTAMPIEEDEEEAEAEAATTSESKQAETSKKQAGGKYLVVAPSPTTASAPSKLRTSVLSPDNPASPDFVPPPVVAKPRAHGPSDLRKTLGMSGGAKVEPYDKSLKKESNLLSHAFEMHDQAAAVDGGDAAVERTARERCCSFLGGLGGIINPSGPFRLAWDVVIALFIFFVLITEPLSMGFWQGKPDRPKSNLQTYGGERVGRYERIERHGRPIGVVNDIMDCIFLVDLFLNFRTGYYTTDGVLIMDPKLAAWEYTRTWFLLDFASSITPVMTVCLSLLGLSAGGASNMGFAKVFKLTKVSKVFKAFRIGKFLKLLNGESELATQVEELITSSSGALFGKVISISMSSFLIAHLLACFMAMSGDGWMRTYDPRAYDDDPASAWSWQRQYLAAIYWAFTTMTTVGYGDITPAGDMDRVYAIFAMLIGVSFYSYIIASVSSMVSSVDTKNAVYFEKMEELSSWMDHYGLEPALKRRVRRFFKQFYADHSAIDDQYILERLSPVLQEAISTYLLHDYILEHSLFNELPEGSLWKIMLIVRNMTFETGAIIVQKGEINVTLFILHHGEVVMEVGEQRRTLDAGDSFGELCLLGVNSESEVTVTALSRAKFFYIRRDAFLEAFSNFPEVFDTMYEMRELFAAKTLTHRGGSQANRKNRHGTRMRNKTMLDGLREGILGKDHKNEKVKKSAYTRLATVKEKLRKTVGKKSKAT